jgi:hypothetical protein
MKDATLVIARDLCYQPACFIDELPNDPQEQ